jgi:CRISPR-associated protein (TIGR02584 family)
MLVSGMSPQVLTETVWALGTPGDFVPTEIRVLTTLKGRQKLMDSLLSDTHPVLMRLCEEWNLAPITFGPEQIEVLQAKDGTLMEDLLTPADNEAAADHICRWIQTAARDEHAALHVSIAGGRKTMGYFAGYALSLFGRMQDRLSHVLVSEPYEILHGPEGFFYPTRESRQVFNAARTLGADARDARVHLAQIPFVRIGLGMHNDILTHGDSFSEAVAKAEKHLATPALTLDFASRSITCGTAAPIRLAPQAFAFYAWLAIRRQTLKDDAGITWSTAPKHPPFDDYLVIYGQSRNEGSLKEASPEFKQEVSFIRTSGFDKQRWEQLISGLRKSLLMALGSSAAQPYLVGQLGGQEGKRHKRGLPLLAPEQIQVKNRPNNTEHFLER